MMRQPSRSSSPPAGWTRIVADIIRRRHGMVAFIDDILLGLGETGRKP
jgi:4-aminobutyrate aminotransferase-like enzyme